MRFMTVGIADIDILKREANRSPRRRERVRRYLDEIAIAPDESGAETQKKLNTILNLFRFLKAKKWNNKFHTETTLSQIVFTSENLPIVKNKSGYVPDVATRIILSIYRDVQSNCMKEVFLESIEISCLKFSLCLRPSDAEAFPPIGKLNLSGIEVHYYVKH